MLAADLIITEFVTSNQESLIDGNGATSDWIEIFNNGDQSIDLVGHALTDDSNDLDKWVFLSRTLAAGEYLVVFASSDGTPDLDGNLHTNFSLSASGEFLALSDLNGVVLTQFGSSTTDFPALEDDQAYGFAFDSTMSTVVTSTSGAQFFDPINASLDAVWTGNSFDDSAWQSGTASIGFEESPADYDNLILTPVPVGDLTVRSHSLHGCEFERNS